MSSSPSSVDRSDLHWMGPENGNAFSYDGFCVGAADGWLTTTTGDGLAVSVVVEVNVVALLVVTKDGLSVVVGSSVVEASDDGDMEIIDGELVSMSSRFGGVGCSVCVGFLVSGEVLGALVVCGSRAGGSFFGGSEEGERDDDGEIVVESDSTSPPSSSSASTSNVGNVVVGFPEGTSVANSSSSWGGNIIIKSDTSHQIRSCTPGKSVVAISASAVLPVPKNPLSPLRKHPLVVKSPT